MNELLANRKTNFNKLAEITENPKFFFLKKLKDKTNMALLTIIKGIIGIRGRGSKPLKIEKILGKKPISNPANIPK